MSAWTFLSIYLAGAALVALRLAWHIRYRLDKYDLMFCDVRSTFWFRVILWPLLLLKPDNLIHPKFSEERWSNGRAEAERELDRMEANPSPCSASIRYAPAHDEMGECTSEFVFDAAEVAAIMEARLAELPAEQHGRYPAILNWLRQRDTSRPDPSDVPAAWNGPFYNVAVGMLNRKLGQVTCGVCEAVVPWDGITLDSDHMSVKISGWSYTTWQCPQKHKLLTKDAIHFHLKSAA